MFGLGLAIGLVAGFLAGIMFMAIFRGGRQADNAMEQKWRRNRMCNHEWIVVSTALRDKCLMLECKLCKALGTVDDPTKEEWEAAFYAPSSPYPWEGEYERVHAY